MALSYAAKQVLWLRYLLHEIGLEFDAPTTLYVDNKGGIDLAKESRFHARTKHKYTCPLSLRP